MSDLNNILANLKINNSEEIKPLITAFQNVTSECLKNIQKLRQEMTAAYIISQKIVIKENDEYIVRDESDVRSENKQHLDIDKKQREEEKILQDILKLLSPTKIEEVDKEPSEKKQNEKTNIIPKKSESFFKKISNLVYKLISIFVPINKNATIHPEIPERISSPMDIIQNNINNLKLYQEELKERTVAFKKLDELQEAISQYKGRIQKDPKEYNKKPSIADKLLVARKTSRKDVRFR